MPADLNTLNEILMDAMWVEVHCSLRTPIFPDRATVARIRREVEADYAEMKLDRKIGPRLGPDRSDLNRIESRRRLRHELRNLVPNKRPGRFVRCSKL